jgi:predicted aspartyl protease
VPIPRLTAIALVVTALLSVPSISIARAAETGPEPCGLTRAAELPLIGDRSLMFVEARIDGSPVTMIVDTGAQWTGITPETVKRLQLPPDSSHGGLHRGVASFSNSINAVARSFEIGGIKIEGRSISVIPLAPGVAVSPPFAGLLGADFLYQFDLDIDLPHRTLTLYRHAGDRNAGCRTGVPPWGVAVAAIPMVKSATNRLNLAASVDGHPFRAIVDTGASISLITRPNALRAGVTAEMLEQDPLVPSHGLGTEAFITRRHVFGEVQIGPERFKRHTMLVGGTLLGGGDMLLGLDYLESRRLWLSYTMRQMFIAAPAAGADRDGGAQPAR